MPQLPIVVVDDEIALQNQKLLTFEFPERPVYAFTTLTSAIAELMKLDSPFALILDHDFPPEGTTERLKGQQLAERLRERHPWGLLLPICYRSGRFSEQDWSELTWELGSFAPNCFARKQGGPDLPEIVRTLDDAFARARSAWLRQAELLLEFDAYDELDQAGEDLTS